MQLPEVPTDEFYGRLSGAFEVLEGFVSQGRIRMYGTATWDGYRVGAEDPCWLSLERVLQAARATSAGRKHHFKVIQLPINIYMPEAAVERNQEIGGKWVTLLDAAVARDLYVISSATLLQRQALGEEKLFSFKALDSLGNSVARRAIQVIRSLDGVTASLVGMKTVRHVRENLKLLEVPKLDPAETRKIIAELV